ncbi:kinetochore complex Sim4 subunit Fta1-domain-containing protein [Durotheca rogersii]|uniref:kinetochore complex Sim4 subunit Fta1-domain-containing protein n=1 Tax=Durotheca rogersii TaxID=419775 RepID=UPI00221F6F35|nr:kinetochore complex Sim4 subunit Fta1-domain-containing protein [Durotheca rogersii]KAI5856752.1 kinetochore complex Sim4 subunit Fta1-domain-containing protein [Durotheca rogersii]
MPPRRRRNNAADSPPPDPAHSPPSPIRSHEAAPSSITSGPDNSSSGLAPDAEADPPPPRFFNTTFTTYRVSPLYLERHQPLSPPRLRALAWRLRDTLVGDVVRGVQVGLEGDAAATASLGRSGALEAVEFRWVDVRRILGDGGAPRRQRSLELGASDDGEQARGEGLNALCVELRYENTHFCALLLPDLAREDRDAPDSRSQPSWTWQANRDGDKSQASGVDSNAFLHLPLLLFRMPAPLKSVIIDFLSTTFDCRISPLALGTRTLVGSLEAWLRNTGLATSNQPPALTKDILLLLGFHLEPPEPRLGESGRDDGSGDDGGEAREPASAQLGLKTIDVAIPAADVRRFLRVGERLASERPQAAAAGGKRKAGATTVLSDEQQARRRRKLAGGRDEEGWGWRRQNPGRDRDANGTADDAIDQPFTEALAIYLRHHLGLDLFHPGVRVQRAACDGFVISEGRLKVFAPTRSRRGAGGDEGEADGEAAAAWVLVRSLVRKARGRPGWGAGATAAMVLAK